MLNLSLPDRFNKKLVLALLLLVTIIICQRFTTQARVTMNSAPVATADSYTVHERFFLDPALTANDFDPDGDTINIDNIVQHPQHGWLSRYTTNLFTYIANGDGYVGQDSFTYRVCDQLANCSIGQVTITLVNQPPAPAADFFTVHGQRFLDSPGIMSNDTDPDNDSLRFKAIEQNPQHGTLYRYGGSIYTYRTCLQFNGKSVLLE